MRRQGQHITTKEVKALRKSFLRGDTLRQAMALAGVSLSTTQQHFRTFRSQGLTRGRRRFAECPAYTGPDWIGKAIDSDSRI
jgi:DNA-binding transcriptional MocR family regulator